MNILFVHQNMPGQFLHLAKALAADRRHRVAFLTRRADVDIPQVLRVTYRLDLSQAPADLGAQLQRQAVFGEAALRGAQALRDRGFVPDIIVGHPGWGELLFLKDSFSDVPLVTYCEYFHDPSVPVPEGDPPRPPPLQRLMDLRAQSAHLLLSLEAADRGWSPTVWQKRRHPKAFQQKIDVIFDGVDTNVAKPKSNASYALPDGRLVTADDEVITYTARSLEPSRGFPSLMRALPTILAARPSAQVIVAGNDVGHYDRSHSSGLTWRETLMPDIQDYSGRVHFVGSLPHFRFIQLLQISTLHVHLAQPTVLSWSLVEALSVGCLVVASTTPAISEVMEPEREGIATTFGDPEAIAADILRGLAHPERLQLRSNAAKRVRQDFSTDVCVPKQIAMLGEIASGS